MKSPKSKTHVDRNQTIPTQVLYRYSPHPHSIYICSATCSTYKVVGPYDKWILLTQCHTHLPHPWMDWSLGASYGPGTEYPRTTVLLTHLMFDVAITFTWKANMVALVSQSFTHPPFANQRYMYKTCLNKSPIHGDTSFSIFGTNYSSSKSGQPPNNRRQNCLPYLFHSQIKSTVAIQLACPTMCCIL